MEPTTGVLSCQLDITIANLPISLSHHHHTKPNATTAPPHQPSTITTNPAPIHTTETPTYQPNVDNKLSADPKHRNTNPPTQCRSTPPKHQPTNPASTTNPALIHTTKTLTQCRSIPPKHQPNADPQQIDSSHAMTHNPISTITQPQKPNIKPDLHRETQPTPKYRLKRGETEKAKKETEKSGKF